MNAVERGILGPVIKRLIAVNSYRWRELKREICEGGGKSAYVGLQAFLDPTYKALGRLERDAKLELVRAYAVAHMRDLVQLESPGSVQQSMLFEAESESPSGGHAVVSYSLGSITEAQVDGYYASLILEEIERRATVAAYRTNEF